MLSHVALALAGLCLAAADWYHVPEVVPGVVVYLMFIGLSWRVGRRFVLPNWAVNLLGGSIAIGICTWFWLKTPHPPFTTPLELLAAVSEAFLEGGFIPYLGPMLMGLLLVRLFRPIRRDDFWLLQGLGLLQVALGCVLGSDLLFGACLLAYLVAALCAVAVHERETQARRALEAGTSVPPRWGAFALRWVLGVAGLVAGLFLLAPRVEESGWQPTARFGGQPKQANARTGFSDLIDLNRSSHLEADDSVAFTVTVVAFDETGRTASASLPADQRWRALVLDRYEEGTWRSDLAWPGAGPVFRPGVLPSGPGVRHLDFEVPRASGCLVLADPLALGALPGQIPVQSKDRGTSRLFFEAGGTAMPFSYLNEPTYRYVQSMPASADSERTPGVRLTDEYLRRLLRCRVQGLERWTVELLRRLATRPGAPADLAAALEGPRQVGWSLPPRMWEAVARLLTDHLAKSGEYAYSMTNERSGVEADPVMDFLAHERQGSCERYASALALMLRSVGIPSRVVKGYRGAEHRGDGVHQVLHSHAHAWVEAVVPARADTGAEWLTLDPTPATEAPDPSWAQWWQQQQRSSQGLWRDLVVGYGSRQQADLWEDLMSGELLWRLLPLLSLLAGGAMVAWLVRLLPRGWARRSRGVAGLYGRLRRLTGKLGIEMRSGQTPQELADEATARLREGEEAAWAEVPGEVVALHYRGRYGGESPGADEVAAVERRMDELEKAVGAGAR